MGNTVLYGATGGSLFAAGRAGERVRAAVLGWDERHIRVGLGDYGDVVGRGQGQVGGQHDQPVDAALRHRLRGRGERLVESAWLRQPLGARLDRERKRIAVPADDGDAVEGGTGERRCQDVAVEGQRQLAAALAVEDGRQASLRLRELLDRDEGDSHEANCLLARSCGF